MVLITIVTGAYKPTYNWGASHCRSIMVNHNWNLSYHHELPSGYVKIAIEHGHRNS